MQRTNGALLTLKMQLYTSRHAWHAKHCAFCQQLREFA